MDGGGGVAASAEPHSPQNLTVGALAAPQAAQARASARPHSPQNLRPASFSLPQATHVMSLNPSRNVTNLLYSTFATVTRMVEAAGELRQDERAWWLRTLLVLTNPREVFAALRDDSDEAAEARQEPLVAIVFLAGAGDRPLDHGRRAAPQRPGVRRAAPDRLGRSSPARARACSPTSCSAALVYLAASFAGGLGSYRRARHLLGYAAVPVAFTVLLVPARAALYGEDAFRRRGADEGATGTAVLDAVEAGLLLWALALLVIGIRTVHGWSWPRSLAAASPLALLLALALGRAYGLI